jgi:hypothetical protein
MACVGQNYQRTTAGTLDDGEMALVFECTGRRVLPLNPPRRLYLLVGRRGGKSRFLSALAVWVAALAANWRNLMAPGEPAVVMLVACDKKQAAVLRRYADGLLQAPLLAPEVVRRTEERIELAPVRCWRSQPTTIG